MTNIGLPRVRTGRRATILDAERDEYERAVLTAVQKAINTVEAPVKQKHVRTCILSTHREKGAGSFWSHAHKLQLEGHPIVAWKFCHVLHQLIRDGHPNVLADSMKYKSKLASLGRLWGHLREGYGPLIKQYCKLLLNKLEFHQRNMKVPGNLQLTDAQLDEVGEQDVNNWFQMGVEMLDCLDEILALQTKVFGSLDMSRATSMTKSGQCRLAPLIPCILDSSSLYDYLVKMLFKLHGALPPDILAGHRDRFVKQFKLLKQFYYSSGNLQYFKYLISVPPLPDEPPNFLQASAFDDYVTRHARLFDEASEPPDTPPDGVSLAGDSQLLDLTEPSFAPPVDTGQMQNHNDEIVAEKDHIINSLQHDLQDAKSTLQRLQSQYTSAAEQMQRRILELDEELGKTRLLVDQMAEENERYRGQAEVLQNENNQATAGKLEATQKIAQTNEEKFNKMKDIYARLRQEHITTLKSLGDLQKEIAVLRHSNLESEHAQKEADQRLAKLEAEREQSQSRAKQSLDSQAVELESLRQQLEVLRTESSGKVDELRVMKESQSHELSLLRAQEEEDRSRLAVSEQREVDSFGHLCDASINSVQDALEQFHNPAHLSVTCSPEYLLGRIEPARHALDNLTGSLSASISQQIVSVQLPGSLSSLTVFISELVLEGKATANAAPSDSYQTLCDSCQSVGEVSIGAIKSLRNKESWPAANLAFCEDVKLALARLETALRYLLGKMGDVGAEELGDLIEREMKSMDAAIQQAAVRIQDMLVKRREEDTGIKLEVNEKILDACNALMMAIIELVRKSRDLQIDIVARGRGTGSVNDFYKRNHQWTEGLLSAAKAVGLAATVLVDFADSVVAGKGKFESLVVASQEIAASSAQLVMASQVKAERGSELLSLLKSASKGVATATASVVGHAKAGQESLQESASLDFTKMTLHEAKRKEMDAKVKVLELEQALAMEHRHLSDLRKKHYELAGPLEGWEEINETS